MMMLNTISQGFRASPMAMGASNGYSGMQGKFNNQSKVEAKYPALLFKQHLTACVEKIYGMIRDSLKKEISPLLNLCIQVSILYIREIDFHVESMNISLTLIIFNRLQGLQEQDQ